MTEVASSAQAGVQSQQDDELREWLDAFEDVYRHAGKKRAAAILQAIAQKASVEGIELPFSKNTPYVNTIARADEPPYPGDLDLEERIRSYIRWNAMIMVMRANIRDPSIGGHIATFSSIATLYEVGFNHFFRGPQTPGGGDMVFFQGHSSPGIYARSFLEGRMTEAHLDRFRQEAGRPKTLKQKKSLSSYPHPWLMPDYWEFPTVSMGLGPLQAVYQAHVMKYLENRGLLKPNNRKVWCFMGDGESDEPESLGGLSLAGREGLDNLIFVVNCNLQRLDGPVRGSRSIIQELEGVFRGANWNVIKVLWGRRWDDLFARDQHGLLVRRMEEAVDGEYQNYKNKGGQYTREHFFGKYKELLQLVANMSDEEIYRLNRGGHDLHKVYAAYARALRHKNQPTVILAKSIKGYGTPGEADNIAHSLKKLDMEGLKRFRDRFRIPVQDKDLKKMPYCKLPPKGQEVQYLHARRKDLGGFIPQRRTSTKNLVIPPLSIFAAQLEASGERKLSTTMAFVRMLSALCRDANVGERIVPIVPDEARTFGMEGLFRQLGIYSSVGQKYVPQDVDQIMFYKEDIKGQIMQEGINEAGAVCAWIAAATSVHNNDLPLIPFYAFYSMFGFQRVGDFIWAAADMQARGFLIGATSGRTTLAGEGLQHLDGHSHLAAATVPNCLSYDPSFAYELAVIVWHGMQRMYAKGDGVFYYLTTMNENYLHPALPKNIKEIETKITKGLYQLPRQQGPKARSQKVRLLGSGTILLEAITAADILADEFGINAEVWSAPSFNELTREAQQIRHHNHLDPTIKPKRAYVEECLNDEDSPIVAATDYVRQYPEQLAPFVSAPYYCLGTDGFGRSDSRANLRRFYGIDSNHIAYYAVMALYRQGKINQVTLKRAAHKLKIDKKAAYPLYQ